MKSMDVLKLYDSIGIGADVEVIPGPLPDDLPLGGSGPAMVGAALP
jgi:hypothetical protein